MTPHVASQFNIKFWTYSTSPLSFEFSRGSNQVFFIPTFPGSVFLLEYYRKDEIQYASSIPGKT